MKVVTFLQRCYRKLIGIDEPCYTSEEVRDAFHQSVVRYNERRNAECTDLTERLKADEDN